MQRSENWGDVIHFLGLSWSCEAVSSILNLLQLSDLMCFITGHIKECVLSNLQWNIPVQITEYMFHFQTLSFTPI